MPTVDSQSTIAAMVNFTGATPPVITCGKGIVSVTRTAAGIFVVTLEAGGIDASECVVATSVGLGTAQMLSVVHTSDTVKTILSFSDAGAAADPTFVNLVFFNCRS